MNDSCMNYYVYKETIDLLFVKIFLELYIRLIFDRDIYIVGISILVKEWSFEFEKVSYEEIYEGKCLRIQFI